MIWGGRAEWLALTSSSSIQKVVAPCLLENVVIVRHHHNGKVYIIEVPDGSRVRQSEAAGEGAIFVPVEGGGEVPIFEEPSELLVELARVERHGLRIISVEDLPPP